MLKKLAVVIGLLLAVGFVSIWLQSRTVSRDVAADRAGLIAGMTPAEALAAARRWAFASATPAADKSAQALLFTNFRDRVSCDSFEPSDMVWERFLVEIGRRQAQFADSKWLFTYKASSTPAKVSFSVTFEQGKLKDIGEKYSWD